MKFLYRIAKVDLDWIEIQCLRRCLDTRGLSEEIVDQGRAGGRSGM